MLQINGSLFDLEPVHPSVRKAASQSKTWAQKIVDEKEKPRKEATTETTVLGGLIYAQNGEHWVLAKKISVTADIVGLSVYTLGEQRVVKVDLTIDEFSNCYAGFVAARG